MTTKTRPREWWVVVDKNGEVGPIDDEGYIMRTVELWNAYEGVDPAKPYKAIKVREVVDEKEEK